uniref:Uncharacterized protein n=1 Tax=Suricata suricatta TaxID=37032 RepID=A0A673SKN9_SURSU
MKLDINSFFVADYNTCTPVFIAAMSTIAKTWKDLPFEMPAMTDEWIQKMWCIYTMEHYSAMRRNGNLSFVTTWMELEGIMQSEISQRKTDAICFHTYVKSEKLNRRLWGKGKRKK